MGCGTIRGVCVCVQGVCVGEGGKGRGGVGVTRACGTEKSSTQANVVKQWKRDSRTSLGYLYTDLTPRGEGRGVSPEFENPFE